MKLHNSLTLLCAAMAVVQASASIPSKFQITPGDGAEVPEITAIEVYMPSDEDVFSYPSPDITINGQPVAVTHSTSGASSDRLLYTLAQPVTEAGEYAITIGAESFYYGWYETDNPEISWTVTVKSQGGGPVTVPDTPYDNPGVLMSPAQGEVTLLDQFNIDFQNVFMVDFNPSKKSTLVDNATGQTVATGTGSDGAGTSGMLITLDRTVTAPGSYTLIVPEGAFYDYMTDDDLPECRFLYTIKEGEEPPVEEPENVTAVPADGTTVTELAEVTVTYDDFDVIYLRSNPQIEVTDASGAVITLGRLDRATLQANAVRVVFDAPVTASGEYTVTIPKNVVLLGEEDQRFARTVTLNYTVEGLEVPPLFDNRGITVDPVQGIVSYLESFTLTFTEIQLPDINYTKKIELIDQATDQVVATGKASTGAVINQLVIDLDHAVTEAGTYVLVCPEGAFYNGGSWEEEDMPEYKFIYVVDGKGNKPVVTPDNTIVTPPAGEISGPLSSVSIVFPDFDAVYKHSDESVRLTDASGQEIAKGTLLLGDYANEMTVKLWPEVNQAGEFILEVPARAMILGDMKFAVFSAPLEIHYTMTPTGIAVTAIDSDGSHTIYDLNGIPADSNRLTPGAIYIIDGKKIIVR